MSSLRIGLIGCGRIARLTHAHALDASSTLELVAVADPEEAARRSFTAQSPGVTAYASAEDLIRHEGLQAVLIATPPATHVPLALRALDAGLHVYLEKPVASTAAESRELLAAWRTSGRVVMVGFNQRAHPLVKQARSLLRDGRIGTPTLFRSVFCSTRRELPEWKRKPDSGGGVLLDLASHHLDTIPWLLGTRVQAVSARVSSRASQDDSALLTLSLENGVDGQIAVSMAGSEVDRVEVMGEKGLLTIDRFANRIEVQPARRARSRKERIATSLQILRETPRRVWTSARAPKDPSYYASLERFSTAILGGAPASPVLMDGHRNMLVVEAAMTSAANDGRFETIEHDPADPEATKPAVYETSERAANTTAGALPELSVVMVGVQGFASIALGLQRLDRQTTRESIELIVIGPDRDVLITAMQPLMNRFHSIQVLEDRKIDNVDVAAAQGIRVARAPVVAIVEDHAYPHPDWAAGIVRAHRGSWVAVGSAFRNANPSSVLSWANLLMSYGQWCEPVSAGLTSSISRHNVSFKTQAAVALGDLESRLGRDGNLLDALKRNGGEFSLAPDAVVEHLNFSRLMPTIELRIKAGRLAAAKRARREKWSSTRRLLYVAASPLIPIMRTRPLIVKVVARSPHASRGKRIFALLIGTGLDAVGQALGFAFGDNGLVEQLAEFEMGRERFLTQSDREQFSSAQAPT